MKQAGRSARFKRKALARWRWLAARGVELGVAAAELGVGVDELRAWIDEAEGRALIVPVQIVDEAAATGGGVVVLIGGVRIEGLRIAEVAELVRRLT
mgnify:CR=1 FL=1